VNYQQNSERLTDRKRRDVSGFCLRPGREGCVEAGSAGGVSVLRRDGASRGRRESVEVLFRAFLLPEQAQALLRHMRQTLGRSVTCIRIYIPRYPDDQIKGSPFCFLCCRFCLMYVLKDLSPCV
jgi:hypothetical protein